MVSESVKLRNFDITGSELVTQLDNCLTRADLIQLTAPTEPMAQLVQQLLAVYGKAGKGEVAHAGRNRRLKATLGPVPRGLLDELLAAVDSGVSKFSVRQ